MSFIIPTELVSEAESLTRQTLGGPSVHATSRRRRKDGTLVDVEIYAVPLVMDDKPLGFLGLYQDITERKQAEQALAQERDLLGTLMDNLPDYIYFKDRQSRFVRTNMAHAKAFGLSDPGQAVGKTDFDFFTAEHAQQAYNDEQEVITTGKPMTAKEEKETWPDGRVTWASTIKMPFRDVNGAIIGTFGVSRDTTERKRAEEALRESEEKYRALIETTGTGYVIIDTQGRVVDANPEYVRLTGRRALHEILGHRIAEWTAQHDLARTAEAVRRCAELGFARNFEIEHVNGDGKCISIEVNATVVLVAGAVRMVGLCRDITERKRAEQALRESEARYRRLFEQNLAGVFRGTVDGHVLDCNDAYARMLGYNSPQEILDLEKLDYFYDAEEGMAAVARLRGEGSHTNFEVCLKRRDGSPISVLANVTLTEMGESGLPLVEGTLIDITMRKRAEEALRTSEERYRELFENASDLVYTTDLEGRLTSLNRVAEQTLGYSREEAAQMNLRQLVDPRRWQRVEQTRERLLAGDSAVTLELEITAKDGRRVMLEVNPRLIYKGGKPVGMQGIGRDITGREEREMELRHAQKLESVGRLASGIAHEINTPIQFVGDNTRFVRDSFRGLQTLLSKYQELRDAAASGAVSPDLLAAVRRAEEESDYAYLLEEIPKALTQTLDGVTRVATLVRAMKDFAHPESKEKAAADLNKALLSTLIVARNELKCVAHVETDLGDLPPVVCNISDLNQVFLNLLVNAAHAIGDVVKGTGKKGKIRVRTVTEGKTVLVTITDTGCGIPEGIRTKVFDPFFTTKGVGRGTGQGLAIARSVVVERHKGTLTFESEVGKGTSFYVRLPVESEEYSEKTRAA